MTKTKARQAAFTSLQLASFVTSSLQELADKRKAVEMAAYMKTKMPFYGVQKPERLPIIREFKRSYKAHDQESYEKNVLALWRLKHREEKYLAINYAESFPEFVCSNSIDLYERLIQEGAWWDFVDAVSINLAGEAYLKERRKLKARVNQWSRHKDMWLRRASLLVHQHHKDETDVEQLFSLCLLLAGENEFFIRKAIGWALREYSKTDPAKVRAFLLKEKGKLSALSFREGGKHLIKLGLLEI